MRKHVKHVVASVRSDDIRKDDIIPRTVGIPRADQKQLSFEMWSQTELNDERGRPLSDHVFLKELFRI
jgi:hypothetical protein